MKRIVFISIIALWLSCFLGSCLVVSLHPLGSEQERIWTPDLIGFWSSQSHHEQFLITRHPYQNIASYRLYLLTRNPEKSKHTLLIPGPITDQHISSIEESVKRQSSLALEEQIPDTIRFAANMYRIGDDHYLDLFGDGDTRIFENFLPIHTFMKVSFGHSALQMHKLDDEKLSALFEEKRVRLPHEVTDGGITLITAEGYMIKKFLAKYTEDPRAFLPPILLQCQ